MVIAPRAFHFGIAFGPGITVAVNISTAPHASTIAYAMGFLVQLSHDVEELVNRARSKADAKADAKVFPPSPWSCGSGASTFGTRRSLARSAPPTACTPSRRHRCCLLARSASLIALNSSDLLL